MHKKIKYVRTVEKNCPLCGNTTYLRMTEDQNKQWEHFACYGQQGKLIQDALPSFDKFGREFIKSGYCPDCQEDLFGSKLDDKTAYFSKGNQAQLNQSKIDNFLNETKDIMDFEERILSKAAEKLSIPEKVLYLYEMDLEENYYVNDKGNVLQRASN